DGRAGTCAPCISHTVSVSTPCSFSRFSGAASETVGPALLDQCIALPRPDACLEHLLHHKS
ncbi:MAG: hypothetical protein ACYDDA_05570, partial [Acidiferrobacteraceae bacterium]